MGSAKLGVGRRWAGFHSAHVETRDLMPFHSSEWAPATKENGVVITSPVSQKVVVGTKKRPSSSSGSSGRGGCCGAHGVCG